MVTYTVAVEIDPSQITSLNLNKSTLCIGRVVKDTAGVEHCNIIAATCSTVQPHMKFTWTDEYKIVGAKITFKEGVTISGQAGGHSIEGGQMYTITDWSTETVSKDESVPNDSFGFTNKMLCSPILMMKIDNAYQPIYISAAERGEGTTIITPMPKVHVWFQDSAVTATMSANYKSRSWPVSLVADKTAWAQYTAEGKFTGYTPSK
ncbi:hypothetical protein SAMD00023353_0105370 [Rosellinia necatrix]|uniref:Uncharacterized protein n=1 Tax=Rosellinia necatrix TaxID=77044 RepID=A0A1S7UIF1_ROSNE|nr:hypothetical protein SAMD00023353_0105370 [Rosellinia necatrix]